MKEIAKRIWNEPAVFIGFMTALALVVINLIGNNEWGFEQIIAVLAPLLSALGIRQAVIPTAKLDAKLDELTAPTTYQKPTKV